VPSLTPGWHCGALSRLRALRRFQFTPVMPLGPPKSVQQLTHLTLTDKRMAKGQLGLDLVAVAAPMPLAQNVALLDQLGEDFVGAALGDANRSRNIAQSDAGILSDAEQNVGVVGEEVPTGNYLAGHLDLPIVS
jgi:hypothetical protein